jgi:hypothetical protein
MGPTICGTHLTKVLDEKWSTERVGFTAVPTEAASGWRVLDATSGGRVEIRQV